MSWAERKQALFRRALQTSAFAGVYGRVIGPASAELFGEVLGVELLPRLPTGARVLEVGCGPGLQAIGLVMRRPDLELTASDFSAPFVRLAEQNARAAGAALRFAVADAMDLSQFPAESFDAVYSVTAIKHFPDAVRGLRECLRVLKRGRPLVVCEIKRESDLAEVQSLVALFRLPASLRPLAARFVHGSLRDECPDLPTVEGWLRELRAEGQGHVEAELKLPAGRPAWVAMLRSSAS